MPLDFTPEEAEHGPKYVEKIIDEAVRQKNPMGPDRAYRESIEFIFQTFVTGLKANAEND